MACTHHHANPPEGTLVHCVRCDSSGRTKLLLKFATAAHIAGITNLWDAQELVSIEDLAAVITTKKELRRDHS